MVVIGQYSRTKPIPRSWLNLHLSISLHNGGGFIFWFNITDIQRPRISYCPKKKIDCLLSLINRGLTWLQCKNLELQRILTPRGVDVQQPMSYSTLVARWMRHNQISGEYSSETWLIASIIRVDKYQTLPRLGWKEVLRFTHDGGDLLSPTGLVAWLIQPWIQNITLFTACSSGLCTIVRFSASASQEYLYCSKRVSPPSGSGALAVLIDPRLFYTSQISWCYSTQGLRLKETRKRYFSFNSHSKYGMN
jgi:hypothetical protein